MITTCTGCQARYRLAAQKVPPRKIRVRCPACATVFDLDGTCRETPPAASAARAATPPAAVPVAPPQTAPAQLSSDLVLESAASLVDRAISSTDRPAGKPATSGAPAPAASAAATAVAEPPRQSRRSKRDKTEMLARALVSDILVYNQETRDKALAAGNLLEALGPEIKKSWELYKEKVGAETATKTTYFKDALNDILADGKPVF